nr:hypothetical protein OH837_15340 [Streptomyces canus]
MLENLGNAANLLAAYLTFLAAVPGPRFTNVDTSRDSKTAIEHVRAIGDHLRALMRRLLRRRS